MHYFCILFSGIATLLTLLLFILGYFTKYISNFDKNLLIYDFFQFQDPLAQNQHHLWPGVSILNIIRNALLACENAIASSWEILPS